MNIVSWWNQSSLHVSHLRVLCICCCI